MNGIKRKAKELVAGEKNCEVVYLIEMDLSSEETIFKKIFELIAIASRVKKHLLRKLSL